MDEHQGKTVSMWLRQDQVETLDRLAKRARISRSKLLSNLIDVAIDEAKFYEATGFITLVGLIRDMQESVKRKFEGAAGVESPV